jgi:hypothetical protein
MHVESVVAVECVEDVINSHASGFHCDLEVRRPLTAHNDLISVVI